MKPCKQHVRVASNAKFCTRCGHTMKTATYPTRVEFNRMGGHGDIVVFNVLTEVSNNLRLQYFSAITDHNLLVAKKWLSAVDLEIGGKKYFAKYEYLASQTLIVEKNKMYVVSEVGYGFTNEVKVYEDDEDVTDVTQAEMSEDLAKKVVNLMNKKIK